MDAGGLSWSLITIVGAALLAIVLAWAVLRNRASPQSENRTEQATRELYRDEQRAHSGEDDNVP